MELREIIRLRFEVRPTCCVFPLTTQTTLFQVLIVCVIDFLKALLGILFETPVDDFITFKTHDDDVDDDDDDDDFDDYAEKCE